MALTPTVLTDAYISIAGTTVSDHGNKVELPVTVEDEDTTCFGQTYHTRVGGLKDGNLSVTFLNDFVQTNLDQVMWGFLGTVITFEIRSTSGARSVTNPAYTGSILVNGWKPVAGDVGKLATVDVSFPTSGTVLRQTS